MIYRYLCLVPLLCLGCATQPASDEEPYREYAPYNRAEASGTEAAVVSGHPIATAAGHKVLNEGGNAVDAAVTMAALLPVLRPHMNGVGGDSFGLFYEAETGEVTALNGSGRSGEQASPDFFREQGLDEIPSRHGAAVTVPGSVSAWAEALDRYGTLSFDEALGPAIHYAREGFPVTPTLKRDFDGSVEELNEAGRDIFSREGEPLQTGELLRNPALGQTLQTLAEEGPSALYGGPIGRRLADFVQEEGGSLRLEDFERHEPTWVEPLRGSFRGRTVYAFPPNTQGVALPMQLAMAEARGLEEMEHNSAEYLHTLIELKKLAFADRDRWVADPETDPPIERLLNPDYLHERSARVSDRAAEQVEPGIGPSIGEEPAEGDGDTVYIMVVDEEGNAVSWIQSIFWSFGSGLVEPETGIVLQNRGAGFTLQEGHPNRIEPSKRPFHTLSPALVTGPDGQLEMTIGTPGGHGQTQSKTQVLHNLFQFDMEPQEAVEAARFRSYGGTTVALESRVSPDVRNELRERGHELNVIDGWTPTFGGMQLILVDQERGVLRTAADPRREGYSLAW